MPKPLTLRFVFRTLARLKHATKLGPNDLAYAVTRCHLLLSNEKAKVDVQ
jgi:hypothetical protein